MSMIMHDCASSVVSAFHDSDCSATGRQTERGLRLGGNSAAEEAMYEQSEIG